MRYGTSAVYHTRGVQPSFLLHWSTCLPDLPTGTVTFLFTDVEGSTRLWEQQPAAMRQALVRHDALIEQAVACHDGVVVRPRGEGDSRFAVFARRCGRSTPIPTTFLPR